MQLPSLQIGKRHAAKAIVQQGMAILISRAPLAAAVANAGGIGIIGGTCLIPEELRAEIRRTMELLIPDCPGFIGVNLMGAAANFDELMQVCIEEEVPIFTGAGIPQAEIFSRGTDVVPIVSSARVVRIMAQRYHVPKPVALVGETSLAGGHLGDLEVMPLELLRELQAVCKEIGWDDVPIIIAGGVQKPEVMAELFREGAAGCGVGTRFAMTTEAREYLAPWQDVMLDTKPEDVVVIGFIGPDKQKTPGSPTGYPSRPKKTPLVFRLGLDGFIPVPDDPKWRCQKEICLVKCQFRDSGFTKSFCVNWALRKALEGDYENGLFFTGAELADIKSIISVPEYFEEIEAGLAKAA